MKLNQSSKFRFTPREFVGSLGDLGTLLPLLIGLIVFNGLSTSTTLVVLGVTYVFTGAYYRLPVPVQPLKAAAMIAIATGVSAGEIRAAALLMAAILMLLTITGLISRLSRLFPRFLIQGIQFGLGLMMIRAGVKFAVSFPDSLSTVVAGTHALQGGSIGFFPSGNEFRTALTMLVLPQLPLTLGNSVLATRDCSLRYFGMDGERVTAGRLAFTVSLGNLLAGLFGGMPICHGAGGMTAHYCSGARTGAAAIMLGILIIGVAVIGGGSVTALLSAVPAWLLGALLVYVGVRHGLLAREAFRFPGTAVTVLCMGAVTLLSGNFLMVLAVGLLAKVAALDLPVRARQWLLGGVVTREVD